MWPHLAWGRAVPVFHDPRYRLPLPALEPRLGIEPRRADLVVWSLVGLGSLRKRHLHAPPRISFRDLERVHAPAYLDSLLEREALAKIFAIDPAEVEPEALLDAVRLACGGTLAAARLALRQHGPAVNLLGGFHHAAPERGAGLCALNDVAVALAALRAEGHAGGVAILDLDAHPPDGTAACLGDDPLVFHGSISASDFGPLPGVDEVRLAEGAGDAAYLAALEGILARMPLATLTFVLAGGDVLAGDRLGRLALTLDGARQRDLKVARALAGRPSVWLPAGGYHADAWKVLAGTVLALRYRSRRPLPDRDPLADRYARVSSRLTAEQLGWDTELTADDLDEVMGRRPGPPRLLGFYSPAGLELALHRYGILPYVARLGYAQLRVAIEPDPAGGDRARLFGTSPAGPGEAGPREHLLIDCGLAVREVAGARRLYVNWLSLRHPRARFAGARPRLPGQEVPGLGLLREMNTLLERLAARLGLAGAVFRPAHLHTALIARRRFRFLDAAREGRFLALARDLAALPMEEASRAVAEGRVLLDGAPYAWEADEMCSDGPALDEAAVARSRDETRFTLRPCPPTGTTPSRGRASPQGTKIE